MYVIANNGHSQCHGYIFVWNNFSSFFSFASFYLILIFYARKCLDNLFFIFRKKMSRNGKVILFSFRIKDVSMCSLEVIYL